jgi:hypothetical protein
MARMPDRRDDFARSIAEARRDLNALKREIAGKRAAVKRDDEAARVKCDVAFDDFVRAFMQYAEQQEAGLNRKWDGQPRTEIGRFDFGKNVRRQENVQIAARVSPALEAFCERQYDKDVFQCKMVGLPACYAQAALRYANCLRGLPIPPLNY